MGAVFRKRWVRHALIAPFIATILVAGVASRYSSGLAAGALDGDTFGCEQKSKFRTETGRFDFNFAYPAFGKRITFGADGPFTFTLIGAGEKIDGVAGDVDGTYSETSTDNFSLTISPAGVESIEDRIRQQLLRDARQQGYRKINAFIAIDDLPSFPVVKIGSAIVVDFPGIQLEFPSHIYYRATERFLDGGADAQENVECDELPQTGPSEQRTAATGGAIAFVALGALWWRRRLAPAR
jgi:LPXTG-motif cell wall-anchored protein